jgi:NADH-quinone oxidoreductase subunit J
MLFLIIYIGAIIVLFLFVIMMLNIKIIQFKERFILYLPIGFFLGLIFIFEIFYLVNSNFLT